MEVSGGMGVREFETSFKDFSFYIVILLFYRLK